MTWDTGVESPKGDIDLTEVSKFIQEMKGDLDGVKKEISGDLEKNREGFIFEETFGKREVNSRVVVDEKGEVSLYATYLDTNGDSWQQKIDTFNKENLGGFYQYQNFLNQNKDSDFNVDISFEGFMKDQYGKKGYEIIIISDVRVLIKTDQHSPESIYKTQERLTQAQVKEYKSFLQKSAKMKANGELSFKNLSKDFFLKHIRSE